ncbi:P-loop NTPase family protein [Clostridium butyricum]|uniref:hypothetical protein n=1 Tax=Clostridium butyricum TaxID=1492 RepID=UPI00374E3A7A
MYAVLSSPVLWREIEQTVLSKGEQVIYKVIEEDIDVVSEFSKIGRTPIKHLIIDLTAITETDKLLNCLRRYRVLNDTTQIIVIAPNITPPNSLMDSLVKMGIYDIYNPQAENMNDIILLPSLIELIDSPQTYKKAVRWILDFDVKEEKEDTSEKSKKSEKFKKNKEKEIKEVKVIQEKVKIIEKEVTRDIEVLGDSVITLLSAAPTGKSYLGWNLAYALSIQGYKIAYVNVDICNSSNFFFGIEDEEPAFEHITSKNKNLQTLVDDGYIINDNLTIYTGEFGKQANISKEVFSMLLSRLRADNDIVIIDPASGFSENLMIALQYTNTAIMISDLDYSHLEMNLRLLDKISALLNKNKTIAVINNIYENSNKISSVEKVLKEKDLFKEIVKIRNAGNTTYDYVNTDTCNYLEDDSQFTEDFKILLDILRVKTYNKTKRKKGLFSKIFKK